MSVLVRELYIVTSSGQSKTKTKEWQGQTYFVSILPRCPCFGESNEGLKKGWGQLNLSILARSPCFGESIEGLKKGRDPISGAHFNKVLAL